MSDISIIHQTRMAAISIFSALTLNTSNTAIAQEPDMAHQKPEMPYTLNLNATNMVLNLRINGAPVITHNSFQEVLFTWGITGYLQTGENLIEINYEPYDLEAQSYTPHEGVRLQLKLSRQAYQRSIETPPYIENVYDPREAEVHLFSGQYNVDTGTMLPSQDGGSVFREGPLITSQNGLIAPGEYTLEPDGIVFVHEEAGEFARKLRIPFTIDDTYLPTPPWLRGEALVDSRELRLELYDAYRSVYQAISRGNKEAYIEALSVNLSHVGLTRGYEDYQIFGNLVLDHEHSFWRNADKIGPLPDRDTFLTAPLVFGTNQRMVRLDPNPIAFRADDGSIESTMPYFFCRIPDYGMSVCYQDEIPYGQ